MKQRFLCAKQEHKKQQHRVIFPMSFTTFIIITLLTVISIMVWIAISTSNQKRLSKERADNLRSEKQVFQKTLDDYIDLQLEGNWDFAARGRIMHLEGQPHCLSFLSKEKREISFHCYELYKREAPEGITTIELDRIVSLKIVRPTIEKSRVEYRPVAKTQENKKSPVVRGLVGGAVLGPAGVVLGAASGLKTDGKTEIENVKVRKKYSGLGKPQLIIGVRDMEEPYRKIQFESEEGAEKWEYRLKELSRNKL